MTTKNIESPQPVIRHERDLIAYIVNTLGYWPHNSAVFALMGQKTTGPLLRVDLDLMQSQAADALGNLLEHHLKRIQKGLQEGQLFVFIFGNSQHPRTANQPMEPVLLAKDNLENQLVRPYIQAVREKIFFTNFTLTDALYIGATSYWGVLYPQQKHVLIGSTQEVLESPLYTFHVTQGTTVSDQHLEKIMRHQWKPGKTDEESQLWHEELDRWYRIYQHSFEENPPGSHQSYWQQNKAQLDFWNIALERTSNLTNQCRSQKPKVHSGADMQTPPATALRQRLPAQLVGYLLATLHETSFIHHLLYLSSAGPAESQRMCDCFETLAKELEPESLSERLDNCTVPLGSQDGQIEEKCQYYLTQSTDKPVPLEIAQQELDLLAQTITGASPQQISWARLEALEVLSFLMLENAISYERFNVLGLLAWINWLKGQSSEAHYYLEQAELEPHQTPLILQVALEANSLPEVVFDAEKSWSAYSSNLLNPERK